MSRMSGGLLVIAGLVLAGCVAPQPQVVYVPYPPAVQPAPAAPVMAVPDAEDRELQRGWRRFCIETASEVELYVYARDEGLDFARVRDWALEREAEDIQQMRRDARTPAQREGVDALAELTMMLTQRMVQQVYQRPYGTAEQERRLWIENCMDLLD